MWKILDLGNQGVDERGAGGGGVGYYYICSPLGEFEGHSGTETSR